MMQRLLVTMALTMARVMARAEPHTELGEGDSPCLHKPCEHGVCVESASSVQARTLISGSSNPIKLRIKLSIWLRGLLI